MSLIDKTDFSKGFWIGLGLLVAIMVLGYIQLMVMRVRSRNG